MLNHIIIPPSATSIGECAFGGCTSLREIIFPDNILQISQDSFRGCIRLKKMTFLDQITNTNSRVQKLGRQTFIACVNLVEVNLSCYPVYTLKVSCFEQCESLERVIISKKIWKLMKARFGLCSSLKYIGYERTLKSTENSEIKFGLDLKHIDLISSKAFVGCMSLESVRLHNNKYVQIGSFDKCKNLKKIITIIFTYYDQQ